MAITYSIPEFCEKFGVDAKEIASALHRNKFPEMECVDGRMRIPERVIDSEWFRNAQRKTAAAKRVRYDTRVRDQLIQGKAEAAFLKFADIASFREAAGVLRGRFGVKAIHQLDMAHQQIATDIFEYRAQLQLQKEKK